MSCKLALVTLLSILFAFPKSWAEDRLPTLIRPGAFSSDNEKLFVDYCVGKACHVAAVTVKTSAITVFVPTNSSETLSSPSVSNDGGKVAVQVKSDKALGSTTQLAILDLRTADYRVITNTPTYKDFPSFGPGDLKLIFAQANRQRPEGRTRFSKWDIYEVELRTGRERRLTEFCFFLVSRPQYFPDGKAFIFSGDPTCNYPAPGSSDSYRAYVERHQHNTIFKLSEGEMKLEPFLVRGPHSDGPRIAKSGGNSVVFVSRTNDLDQARGLYNYDLFKYERNAVKRLTTLKTYLTGLAQSNNGRFIAYTSDPGRNGNEQLWVMDIETGTQSQILLRDRAPEYFQITKR